MDWEKPRIVVIEMNAEVGAYQEEFIDDPTDIPEPAECDMTPPSSRLMRAPAVD